MWTLRRVVGESMSPTLRHGQIVLIGAPKSIVVDNIVVINHQGLDKIKRITKCKDNQIYVQGDNPSHSTDSRNFGWVPLDSVTGRVIFPRNHKQYEV